MEAKFTKFNTETNWVEGKVGEHIFQAKLYDENSIYGINEGRVSKLWIQNSKNKKTVVNYDRGWDIEPSTSEKPIFNSVMTFLENSPKRFE